MNKYLDLQKRAFLNGFKGSAYRDWWSVPVKDRLIYAGLPAGFVAMVSYVIFLASPHALTFFLILVVVLVVGVPLQQMQVDKLISKYKK
jgi:hypothetical protein